MAGIDLTLYAIVDPGIERDHPIERFVRDIIEGGATSIQVRCKRCPREETLAFARRVIGAARPAGAAVIVNDDLEAALAAGADGVHLGGEDLPLLEAGRRLSRARGVAAGFLVGASARTVAAAGDAEDAGAHYLGVGPVFATPNKPGVAAIDLDVLRAIRREISLPIVAIGGINETNAGVPLSCGVDGVAVISALRGPLPPREAAARLRARIDEHRRGKA